MLINHGNLLLISSVVCYLGNIFILLIVSNSDAESIYKLLLIRVLEMVLESANFESNGWHILFLQRQQKLCKRIVFLLETSFMFSSKNTKLLQVAFSTSSY